MFYRFHPPKQKLIDVTPAAILHFLLPETLCLPLGSMFARAEHHTAFEHGKKEEEGKPLCKVSKLFPH